MPTHIALLRAVNLAGYGKLAMADLRTLLQNLGYTTVRTYIQSGNAVFDSPAPPAEVAESIAAALERHMGARTGVLMRSHAALTRVIRENPYAPEAAADGSKVHVAFLGDPAPDSAAAVLDAIVARYPQRRDRYHLAGDHLYLHLPDGAADTKFTGRPMERAFDGVPATARNWNTVLKLHQLSTP